MRKWETTQSQKKDAMVARARERDARRHERREQTAVERSQRLAWSLGETNATNEALRSMVRDITTKHVEALAALGAAEDRAATALESAAKLQPQRAFSEEEAPTEEEPTPEPTTPQLRFAKARSDARDDLHAARVAAEAARATKNADREALAAARKKLWALVGVLADADAELEASQRNPDGLGVDELTQRVDAARAASADADAALVAASASGDVLNALNATVASESLVDGCRDARQALDAAVAALDSAARVASTGKAGENATPRRLERETAQAYRVRVGRALETAAAAEATCCARAGASAMGGRRTQAAAAALEQCLNAFDDLGTEARAPPSPRRPARSRAGSLTLRTPRPTPAPLPVQSKRRPLHEPKIRQEEVEEVQTSDGDASDDDAWADDDWAFCLLDGKAKRGTLTAQTEPLRSVAERRHRLAKRRELLDEHYPWDEHKGVRRDAESGRSCARLHMRVVAARNLPKMRRHRGSCDAFVEVAIDGATPKKTGAVPDSLYPTWTQERFVLRVNRAGACLRCRVLDAPPARGEPPRPVGACSLLLSELGERPKTLWLPLAQATLKTRLADDCALRVECRLVVDPAPLLDRALKRLDLALATRVAPNPPSTPPRAPAAAAKTATDARGRFVATPPKPPAGATTSPSPRSSKPSPASPESVDLRIFRSPARRQAHPTGRSPRSRSTRSSRPWRGS